MTETPTLLTIPEAAERLRVHRNTLLKLLQRGELGSVRIGKRRLIPAQEIDRFIKNHTEHQRATSTEEATP
jgi:excisionase family DNA binding protein